MHTASLEELLKNKAKKYSYQIHKGIRWNAKYNFLSTGSSKGGTESNNNKKDEIKIKEQNGLLQPTILIVTFI